jgi:uncharacterized protein with ParB-like and HNH nuclease domain
MTPGKSKIAELFNGTRVFQIPFYQRSYVWDEKEWERLLADIIAVGNKTTDYFLGAIILKQVNTGMSMHGDYKIVIDGQQRLTTLAIFLKVLYLKLGMNQWFERKFVLPDGTAAIQHSHMDKEEFSKIMELQSCDSPLEGKSNIVRAYNFFRERLDPSQINEMRLNNNIQVIDIVIDNNDDEQQIFDTINSLGVDLTTAELLKNHLFTEENLRIYETLWAPAFEADEDCIEFWAQPLLKGRNKQKNIEAFLNAFLQIKVQDSNLRVSAEEKVEYSKSSALFYNYKKFIKDYYTGREFDFVRELVEYAKIYYNTFSPEITEHSLTFKAGLDRVNFLIFATDGTTMIPYVMYVIKNVEDEEERNKIFAYLESYIVRRLICRKSTKNYSDLFSENLVNANIQTAEAFINYINEKDSSNALAMPNNTELLRCCKEIEHPNYRGLAILYLMESKMRSSALLTTQLLKYSAYTLEHLMPQKWMRNWPLPEGGDPDARSKKVKTLGNFTMLTQPLNSSISNESWSTKLTGRNNNGLKVYANGLLTLAGVLDLAIWDEKAIETRATWLARKAADLWPSQLPSEVTIEEPIFDDEGEIIIDQITGEEHIISRDHTQYSLDGQTFMGKSHFVPYFVKKYIEKHRNLTFAQIKERFPDTLLESGYKFLGLICPVSAYEQWDNKYKVRRYRADNPESKLRSFDGIEFYVNTQWTAASVQNIIQIAKDDNWEVMIKL